ncbi:MAG TPA: hypothetical protein VHX38_22635 [Pseudonocardiaceae bacterium]|jgi:hypothetical protein|nr:hypothetical protein [Pseudonocardiaceae bacterium]
MRDIRASAEVADMIGAENLHRLRHDPAYGPFTCWHCHSPGDANAEPATVIAELGPGDVYTARATVIAEPYEGAARIALAHAECSRPQVVNTDAPAPAAQTEPGTGSDMRALTADLAGPDGPLSLLILDQRPEMAVRGPVEQVNPFFSGLLSLGLTLVTTISEQLAEAMDGQAGALAYAQAAGAGPWVLPAAPEWRLELSARQAARLTAPDGSIVWDGTCGQARPWRAQINRTNRCAVLIGAIGLHPNPGERAFTRITTLLDQAAHAEELVGGLVEAC